MTQETGTNREPLRPTSRTLFVGIGSPHGDDRAGWLVAESLQKLGLSDIDIRQAATPSHLLDWLDGVDRLIVCDACLRRSKVADTRDENTPNAVDEVTSPHLGKGLVTSSTTSRMTNHKSVIHRWQWPCLQAATLRSAGSHAFGLPQVLQLAERLGKLPRQVVIYGIEASGFSAFSEVTSYVSAAINTAVDAIREELGIARRTEAAGHA